MESLWANTIIQIEYVNIFDIIQQSSITSTSSIIRINIRLVRVSQFFRQFQLLVQYKPSKNHIIPDTLSRLASTNNISPDTKYFELNALFAYYTTLVEINLDLMKHILDGYTANN